MLKKQFLALVVRPQPSLYTQTRIRMDMQKAAFWPEISNTASTLSTS